MRRLLPDDKQLYHLRDYAIVKNEDGTYEYVAWNIGGQTLSWIRGEAKVLGDVLALTSIQSEGTEEAFKTMKEVRKELKKLPDWWGRTKYYCVVLDQFASMVKYCTTGQSLEEEGEEFKAVQAKLRDHGVVLSQTEPRPHGSRR
jgi:hypothetical protein